MSYGIFFWILVLLAVIFEVAAPRNAPPGAQPSPFRYRPFISSVFIFILIILLGLGIYGPALHR